VEQICDRIALLARGELLCVGSLEELLGRSDVYHVTVGGASREQLQPWLEALRVEDGLWHGQLRGDPQGFLAQLPQWNARLVNLTQARVSLEDYFIQQLRERGITSSQ
jgi:ABC-2 type transport system ATP-binding protein